MKQNWESIGETDDVDQMAKQFLNNVNATPPSQSLLLNRVTRKV